jgi:hypothetical protein
VTEPGAVLAGSQAALIRASAFVIGATVPTVGLSRRFAARDKQLIVVSLATRTNSARETGQSIVTNPQNSLYEKMPGEYIFRDRTTIRRRPWA